MLGLIPKLLANIPVNEIVSFLDNTLPKEEKGKLCKEFLPNIPVAELAKEVSSRIVAVNQTNNFLGTNEITVIANVLTVIASADQLQQ